MKYIVMILVSVLTITAWSQKGECVPENKEVETVDQDGITVVAEKMPSFPGGEAAMHQFIMGNVEYPTIDKNAGIQGRVYIKFVVELDGSITGIEILRGLSKTIDAECIRVVKKMPKWTPAETGGLKVRCYYTIPFTFRLG
jgi:protein TonB